MILDLHLASRPGPVARLEARGETCRLTPLPGTPAASLALAEGRALEGRAAHALLSNLLAERPEARTRDARRIGADAEDVLRLLLAGGQDRAGALHLASPDAPVPRLHGNLRDPAHYRPLAAEETPEILQRLQAHGALPDEEDPSPLAGMQPKIALALQGNALLRPRAPGLSPSTHLLKTSAARPAAAAREEHLAMALAAACGLPAARTRLLAYDADGRPTDDPGRAARTGLLVERFDRRVSPDGQVERLHQEDLAQVLGLAPEEKYAHAPSLPADRRYGAGRIGAEVLPRLADPDAGRRDLLRLVLFSLAIGNWDLHAKNIAVLHADAGARLAPFHDLDPVALDPAASDRLALPVGRAERLVDLRPGDLEAFLAELGHPGDPAPMLDDGAHLLRQVSAWAAGVRGPVAKRLADLAAGHLRILERAMGRDLQVPDRDLSAPRGGGWTLD